MNLMEFFDFNEKQCDLITIHSCWYLMILMILMKTNEMLGFNDFNDFNDFNEINGFTIFNDFSTGPAGVVAAVSLACRGLGLPHSTGRRTGWFP